MRRSAVSLLVAIVLSLFSMLPAAALQDTTPKSGLADLGLPSLDVTVTAAAYKGIPESLEAGRYLVTVTGSEDLGDGRGDATFIQPSGMSAEEFLAALAGPADETGAEPASPIAEAAASPAGGEEGRGGPPAALFDATFAGGTAAVAGQAAQDVLDLPPGEWIVGGDPEASQEPFVFETTGEMPTDLAEPESGATITMSEFVIEVTEGAIAAGPQVLKIENLGAQPHFVVSAKGPDEMTEEQIGVAFEEEAAAGMTGTPPAYSDLNPDEDLEIGFNTGTQSTGTTIWVPATLEAGTHVLVCFFPDIASGMPHAFKGMYTIVEVGE